MPLPRWTLLQKLAAFATLAVLGGCGDDIDQTIKNVAEAREARAASDAQNYPGLPASLIPPNRKYLDSLIAKLDYPEIGTEYNRDSPICSSPPSTNGILGEQYRCKAKGNTDTYYGFDSKGKLKAVYGERDYTISHWDSYLSTELLTAVFKSKFGEPLTVKDTSAKKFGSDHDVRAMTWGCAARYGFDPFPFGMLNIKNEDGYIYDGNPYDISLEFFVDAAVAAAATDKCVVASITTEREVVTQLGEKPQLRTYFAFYEVNPEFRYFKSLNWEK